MICGNIEQYDWRVIYMDVQSLVLLFIQVIFEQRERMFHRDIQTRENNVWKHESEGRVFLLIVFECLDIPVGHELELFK